MKPLIGLFALSVMAQSPGPFLSEAKESALGKQLAAEVLKRSAPFGSAAVDAYVKRVGGRLVAASGDARLVYQFEAVRSDVTEPIPLPGGFVFIPVRFFVTAQNEDDFATMLAHAIAHVALRQGGRAMNLGSANFPMVFVGGWAGLHSESRGGSVMIPLGFLRFQRENELEADGFGLKLAARAGFHGEACRDYLERAQVAASKSVFSALPDKDLRLARIDEALRGISAGAPRSSEEFLRCREVLRGSRLINGER